MHFAAYILITDLAVIVGGVVSFVSIWDLQKAGVKINSK